MHKLTITGITFSLAVGGLARASDDVSPELMSRFNVLANRAEAARKSTGPVAAIAIYEEALLEGEGYGRVNLRLGQLYQQSGKNAEAADHYRRCLRDDRVDSIDRQLTCEPGFKKTTAHLHIDGLPEGGRVVVLEPELFAGAFRSGDPLPVGMVKVMVEAPGREPRGSTIRLDRALRWTAAVGLERRQGPLVPSAFLNPDPDEPEADSFVDAPLESGGRPVLPLISAGVGVALVGAGLFLGFDNRSTLDGIRSKQRDGGCASFCGADLSDSNNAAMFADGLWIGGTTLAVSSLVWWYLSAPEVAQ